MSNPRAKAERSKAKDLRQGITEQRPVTASKRKKKAYTLRVTMVWFNKQLARYTVGNYATLRDAEKAAEAARKKSYYTEIIIEEIQ